MRAAVLPLLERAARKGPREAGGRNGLWCAPSTRGVVRAVGVTGAGMLALAWLLARIVRHPLGVWSLTAVIGGGVGNLIDRVRLGYVVDMLDCTFIEFPVFNVADCFVVCGTIAALVYYIWIYPNTDAKNWEKDHGTDPAQGK